MEILTNLTDIIKGMKTWAKLLAIALIVGAVVVVTLFSGSDEPEAGKSVGDIEQSAEQSTTDGGDNTNSNSISF